MSKGIINKVKDWFGLSDEFYDYEEEVMEPEEQETEQVKEETNANDNVFKRKRSNRSNIIDLAQPATNEMIVVEPSSYDDAIKVVSLLKSKTAVIISFVDSKLSKEDTMHIIDFICGAVCAIEGKQKIVAPSVYLFTPGNININSLDSTKYSGDLDKSGSNLFLTVSELATKKTKVS